MALPPSFQRVVVDDASPSFQYGPSWSQISSSSRDGMNSGPAFMGTLHRTTTSTSFSVKFTGSDIVAYASVDPVVIDGVVQADPQWECIVDGNSLGVNKISDAITFPQNNIDICHSILSDGPHTLVVKVTSQGSPFYVDNIQFTPSSGASSSKTVEKVYNSSPDISLSSGFSTGSYGVAQTQTNGATVTYKFTGTSLSWVGYIFGNIASQSATATWSVDGSSPATFALPTSTISYGNTVFFKTPDLPAGAHTLVVTYQGNENTMPLVLDYFFVGNGVSSSSGGGTGNGAIVTGGGTTPQPPAVTTGGKTGGGVAATTAPVVGNTPQSTPIAGTIAPETTAPASTAATTPSTTGTDSGALTVPGSTSVAGTTAAPGADQVVNTVMQSAGPAFVTDSPQTTAGAGIEVAKSKSNTGAIAGGVVGGVLALIALTVLTVLLIKRRRRNIGAIGKPEPFYRDYEQDGSG